MRRIAIYGKGGIGKSTTSANITAALTDKGMRVLQIGCDPKSDSTRLLLNGKRQTTVLDAMRTGDAIELSDVIHEGYGGCFCVECGGPRPGTGCAGRGINAAFEFLESKNVVDKSRLAQIVFSPTEQGARELSKLNALLHPILNGAFITWLKKRQDARLVILDAPLLLEAGMDSLIDYLVYVDADFAVRQKRAVERGWEPY